MAASQREPLASAGDMIVVESERVGLPERRGEILSARRTTWGVEYEVRWDDGRVTSFRPASGSARVVHLQPGSPA